MDADCCLHLYFETAWPSSTINVRSTLHAPCSGLCLCSQDFRLSLYRLLDRHRKRHPKVALTVRAFSVFQKVICVAGIFRVGYIQHMAHLQCALNFPKAFCSLYFMFSQQFWKTEQTISTLLIEVKGFRAEVNSSFQGAPDVESGVHAELESTSTDSEAMKKGFIGSYPTISFVTPPQTLHFKMERIKISH